MCGTYLTTRAQAYGKEALKNKETRKHGPILKHDGNMKNGKRCIDVQPLMGQNLLKNDGYKYQLIEPIMSKDEYGKRMFTKLMWEPDFRVFATFVLGVRKFCKTKYDFSGDKFDSEKEAWRCILLSSQFHYPIKTGK